MIAALSALLDSHLHEIQSVEIVPLESPPGEFFFYESGHLGLPFNAVLPLAAELHDLWNATTTPPPLEVSRLHVLVNGQHARAWNTRKRMLQSMSCNKVAFFDELVLTALVLQLHPKADLTWAHRRWCLHQMYADVPLGTDASLVLATELAVCTRVAGLHTKNFYAWAHRLWLAITGVDLLSHHNKVMVNAHVCDDLAQTRVWLETHVSDHCALHHCFALLSLQTAQLCRHHAHVISESFAVTALSSVDIDADECAVCALWLSEAETVTRRLELFPAFETLWAHAAAVCAVLARFQQHLPGHDNVGFLVCKDRLAALQARQTHPKMNSI